MGTFRRASVSRGGPWPAWLLAIALGLCAAACEESGVDIDDFPDAVGVETRQFVVALRGAGADVEVVETVPPAQSLFGVLTTRLSVNGADVVVYEFGSTAETEAAWARVPTILATSTFPAAPNFYKGNRIIVLYVGTDAAMLGLLERLLGPPFAGLPSAAPAA
jgi:hypothetical protein